MFSVGIDRIRRFDADEDEDEDEDRLKLNSKLWGGDLTAAD